MAPLLIVFRQTCITVSVFITCMTYHGINILSLLHIAQEEHSDSVSTGQWIIFKYIIADREIMLEDNYFS